MKKRTMQIIFIVLFLLGLALGLLVPVDYKTIEKKLQGNGLQPQVFDIAKKLGQLDSSTEYFKYSVLAHTDDSAVELLRIDDKVPMHIHPKENHFVYVYKGRAKIVIGNSTTEVGQGQFIIFPAGVAHSVERLGDAPLEAMAFSSPAFVPNDTVWLEKGAS